MKTLSKFLKEYSHIFIVGGVALLCGVFIVCGHWSENGKYRTLDGSDALITKATTKFIENAQEAMNRVMNEDKPTDESTINANDDEEVGLGFYTTLEDIVKRRLVDNHSDGNNGWQCSRYTGYLATGKWSYSSSHPDYGPVNGKDVANWLVKNYGFKYIDQPVQGAIGSGGFNTNYGHTAMYLYSTGTTTAMVNDANYTPLKVSTHNMDISGWVWVVPGNYEKPHNNNNNNNDSTSATVPAPTATPSPVSDKVNHTVVKGETLGQIIRGTGYTGSKLFGDNGLAQRVADSNNIVNRGLIYPLQVIVVDTSLFKQY